MLVIAEVQERITGDDAIRFYSQLSRAQTQPVTVFRLALRVIIIRERCSSK